MNLLQFLMLFYNWGLFKGKKTFYYSLLFICVAFWSIEEIIFGGIYNFVPFFRIFYSFILVLVSINQLNYTILINSGKNLFRNCKFLLCIAFIIFFIYQILYEAAYFVSDHSTNNYFVTNTIISFFAYINLIVNLIYIPAVYFIPDRYEMGFDKNINFVETS